MKPVADRVLLCLMLGCSLLAVGYAGTCCGFGNSNGPYAQAPSLNYNVDRTNTPSLSGSVGVAYSSSCGDCIVANYNLATISSCTYQGSQPAISSYKCKFYLSYANEYNTAKQNRKNLPCSYSTSINRVINDTHIEACYTYYMGIATADFDISGPKGVARVECKSLTVTNPTNCYTYNS